MKKLMWLFITILTFAVLILRIGLLFLTKDTDEMWWILNNIIILTLSTNWTIEAFKEEIK